MTSDHGSDASVKSDITSIDEEWIDDGGEYTSDSPVLQVAEPSIVNLDERGDKILTVGAERPDPKKIMRFRVCSRALARFSPVMAAMLFGKFRESTQEAIDLPDDDADSMEILLRIAHGDTATVCEAVDIYERNYYWQQHLLTDNVYKIVLLAEKYLMTAQLRPWAANWIQTMMYHIRIYTQAGCVAVDEYQKLERVIFVAYHFGHFDLFQGAAEQLVGVQDRNRAQFTDSLEPFSAFARSDYHGMEIGAADHLRNLRVKLIDRILAPLRDIIDVLNDDTLEDTLIGETWGPRDMYRCNLESPARQKDCHMHTLGVLVRFLTREGLYPLPDAADVDESPMLLHRRLTELWSDCEPLHQRCKTRNALTRNLELCLDVCSSFYAPPPTNIAIMESRRQKFGFNGLWIDTWE
ncbi:hypothetical protein LQW54_000967 [Pestalotiopsis sp. IQ-011]